MTTATATLLKDDNLRSQDLRNPMFHLLQSEGKGQIGRRASASEQQKAPSDPASSRPPTAAARPPVTRQSSSVSSSSGGKKKRHFLPESVCHRVEQSWELVQNDLEDLGLTFFLRVFEENPELLSLLPYGQSYLDAPPEERRIKLRQCSSLRVHSVHVMTAVGNCVAGLKDIESVVPALRALGKTHRMAGVEDGHYKILFKHLSGAIREKIGPGHWDDETAEAWELVYFSLASIMSRPVAPLEAEPVTGWHEVLVLASLYLVVSTPYRLAGFSARVPAMEVLFTILDTVALILFLVDLCSGRIINALRVKPPRGTRRTITVKRKLKGPMRRRFDKALITLKVHALRKIRSVQMDQWVAWPTTDKLVVLGFILQYSYCIIDRQRLHRCVGVPITAAGVHWVHAFGLLRLAALTRVLHALRCAENNLLLRKRVDQSERTMLRVIKLLLTLVYVTHVSACLWCIVARIQLGPATVEANPTEFFPEPTLLMGQTGVINSYFRAVHWAWVSLSGIGNFDSTPVSTLECIATLLVHICGVTLYAIMTGNVVSILEEVTDKESEVGRELADLGAFMMDCSVPPDVQERIMQGYLMRNMITDGAGGSSAQEGGDGGADTPSIGENVLSHLPRHLQNELKVYSRAEALQRRDKSFQDCSADFLFALSGELRGSHMLLPGDYLLKDGEAPQQVLVLDSGTMEVEVDGKTIKILRKGDLLGKRWLLKALSEKGKPNLGTIDEEDKAELVPIVKHVPTAHSFSEWLDIGEGMDAKVRAMSDCTLATGLSSPYDIRALRKRFPKDFAALQHDRQRVIAAVHKVGVTRNIIRAQMAFKRQLRNSASA